MASYAATVRIAGVRPHRRERSGPRRARPPTGLAMSVAPGVEAIELVGHPFASGLREQWGRIRERWAQTTFYLFDAEGWR